MTTDNRISALARLSKTPEQIIAERRTEIQSKYRGLFDRYANWRIKHLDSDEKESLWLTVSLCWRCVQVAASIVLGCYPRNVIAWLVFGGLMFVQFMIVGVLYEEDVVGILKRGLYTLLLPIMPLIIILDFFVVRRDRTALWKTADQEFASLEKPRVVYSYYAEGIKSAREDLLGPRSELFKTECDLQQHLRNLERDKERFLARLQQAGDDVERVDVLNAALESIKSRQANLEEALAKHRETMAKTHAILDECQGFVNKLPAKLEDEQLIRESEAREVGENIAIQKAEEARNHHIDLVRDRVMQLAAIVSAPPREIESANPEGDMRTYFDHLDKMAEKVAVLEAQKAF